MTRKRKDHYLPASYVGRFAAVKEGSARKRLVSVADDRASGPFTQTAENVAFRTGLYDIEPLSEEDDWLGGSLDSWGYEAGLPAALDALAVGDLDAERWARHVVPFVAGLFARGPEQNNGVNNIGRIWAFQEMLAPVMVSRWTVLHCPTDSLITSDRAFGVASTALDVGIAVPIDSSHAILLTRCERRAVARCADGRWWSNIEHRAATEDDARSIRSGLTELAVHSTFGRNVDLLGDLIWRKGRRNDSFPALIVNPEEADLACHIYDYFRFMAAICAGAHEDVQVAANAADLRASLPTWTTPVAVQLNFNERTRGDVRHCNDSELEMGLELGLRLCARRREVGDFRRGAFIVMPFDKALARLPLIGNECRSTSDGRRSRTYILARNGSRIRVDL